MKRRRFDSSWRLSLCNWTIMSHALYPTISFSFLYFVFFYRKTQKRMIFFQKNNLKGGVRGEKSIRFLRFLMAMPTLGSQYSTHCILAFIVYLFSLDFLYSKKSVFSYRTHLYLPLPDTPDFFFKRKKEGKRGI